MMVLWLKHWSGSSSGLVSLSCLCLTPKLMKSGNLLNGMERQHAAGMTTDFYRVPFPGLALVLNVFHEIHLPDAVEI